MNLMQGRLGDAAVAILALEKHTAMPYNPTAEFIETSLFTRLVYDYLSEEESRGLQVYLFRHPDSGDIVPVSGGARKLRWAMRG